MRGISLEVFVDNVFIYSVWDYCTVGYIVDERFECFRLIDTGFAEQRIQCDHQGIALIDSVVALSRLLGDIVPGLLFECSCHARIVLHKP